MRTFGALTLLIVLTVPVCAQQPHYRFVAGDTVRYQESIHTRIVLRPPADSVIITGEQQATIAIVGKGDDTATAWYEALSKSPADPLSESRPDLSAALRLPFLLLLPANGRVATLAVPPFPAEVSSQTDLTHEFEDFFVSLPASSLRLGRVWADTIQSSVPALPTDTYDVQHLRTFQVARDTAVNGQPAVIIAVDQTLRYRFSSPLRRAPMTVWTELSGREEGTAIFALATGRLLSRVRRAHLEGRQVLRGGAREMVVPMTHDYSSSIAVFGAGVAPN